MNLDQVLAKAAAGIAMPPARPRTSARVLAEPQACANDGHPPSPTPAVPTGDVPAPHDAAPSTGCSLQTSRGLLTRTIHMLK